jgi:hypothetical protein
MYIVRLYVYTWVSLSLDFSISKDLARNYGRARWILWLGIMIYISKQNHCGLRAAKDKSTWVEENAKDGDANLK